MQSSSGRACSALFGLGKRVEKRILPRLLPVLQDERDNDEHEGDEAEPIDMLAQFVLAGEIAEVHRGEEENALDGENPKGDCKDGEEAVVGFFPEAEKEKTASEEPDHDPAGQELAE